VRRAVTIGDLLALCAADCHRLANGESRLWLFGPGHTPVIATTLPGPAGLEDEALRSWGRDLSRAASALAGVIPFIPVAVVVTLPDPACPMLDGVIDGAQPVRLLLATAPTNLIGLTIPADESVAAQLLQHARRVACARFN
jgi:hypothetical protein